MEKYKVNLQDILKVENNPSLKKSFKTLKNHFDLHRIFAIWLWSGKASLKTNSLNLLCGKWLSFYRDCNTHSITGGTTKPGFYPPIQQASEK